MSSKQLLAQRSTNKEGADQLSSSIVAAVKKSGGKYIDKSFPPSSSSLFKSGKNDPAIVWKRPCEISENPKLFIDGAGEGDVIQGELGDCWFLGALSVVATNVEILRPIFITASPISGFYQVRFFKDGDWRYVTIDDYLPCLKSGKLVYASCKDKNEYWVPLVEKAYAKLHGSYEALNSGNTGQALKDLTGAPSQRAPDLEQIPDDKLWKQLLWYIKEKFMMGCSYSASSAGRESETPESRGILANHAYGILGLVQTDGMQLIKVRNPWGQKEWTGDWSDNSPKWTPALRKKLNMETKNDGIFWISFRDFRRQFNTIFVCYLLEDGTGHKWNRFSFDAEWSRRTNSDGGCPFNNPDDFGNCPQYYLNVNSSNGTAIIVDIGQPDSRVRIGKGGEYDVGVGAALLTIEDNRYKLPLFNFEKATKPCPWSIDRDAVGVVDNLPKGKYIISPTAFKKGEAGSYFFDLYTYDSSVEIGLIDPSKAKVLTINAGWTQSTGGGCFNHDTWIKNPKYLLQLSKPFEGLLSLKQTGGISSIGIYIFGKYNPSKELTYDQVVHKIQCINAPSIATNLKLSPRDGPFVIMPITFVPQINEFVLSIQGEQTVQLQRI